MENPPPFEGLGFTQNLLKSQKVDPGQSILDMNSFQFSIERAQLANFSNIVGNYSTLWHIC
jgi:hypothetical protein